MQPHDSFTPDLSGERRARKSNITMLKVTEQLNRLLESPPACDRNVIMRVTFALHDGPRRSAVDSDWGGSRDFHIAIIRNWTLILGRQVTIGKQEARKI